MAGPALAAPGDRGAGSGQAARAVGPLARAWPELYGRFEDRQEGLGLERGDAAGWQALFNTAFKRSRNAMVLADDRRLLVDMNGAAVRLFGYKREEAIGRALAEFVEGGPLLSPEEWAQGLAKGEFTGEGTVICGDGGRIAVQWGASTEFVTGRRLVLFVALSTSRWGDRFRRTMPGDALMAAALSPREAEVVHLVALGSSGPEIADELQIAHHTVRTHVRNAMGKLGARSRAHLVAKALGEGHALS